MRILVIGRSGQVGQALAERCEARTDLIVHFAPRAELDLIDESEILRIIEFRQPDIIVNAAAYTDVDGAEDEPETAWRVNADAPGILAAAARRVGATIVHFSTDYVYDGLGDQPLSETARVAPVNQYGRGKLAGEDRIREALPNHVILRTAWVYGPFGRNFVRTMLELGKTRDRLEVVEDQVGSPTSSLDIADAVLAIIAQWGKDSRIGLGETYHLAGRGHASWAELARHVFAVSGELDGPTASVIGIPCSAWPTRAQRPRNLRLDTRKLEATFGYAAPHWRESVRRDVARILANG
jgi:dTDP-4-dehydrorhamnose reductase